MNAKRFVTLTMILTLSLVCLLDCYALLYPSDAFDFTTLNTKRTLEASHIIIGEVTHVSFVFRRGEYLPSSLVTVRIEKDIKEQIDRLTNQGTNPPERQAEGERQTPSQRTVTFVQVGGPRRDAAGWVKVSGFRVLKEGDYVFLKLMPAKDPFERDGHLINSATSSFATTYIVLEDGDDPDDHIIRKAWQGLDITVIQMARIVRATLRKPEQMRGLERRMSELKHLAQDARSQTVMDEVMDIEEVLSLPPFDSDNQ